MDRSASVAMVLARVGNVTKHLAQRSFNSRWDRASARSAKPRIARQLLHLHQHC
jgi:hypothetical protein